MDAATAALSPRDKDFSVSETFLLEKIEPYRSEEIIRLTNAYLHMRNRAGARALYDAFIAFAKIYYDTILNTTNLLE